MLLLTFLKNEHLSSINAHFKVDTLNDHRAIITGVEQLDLTG